MGHDPHQTGGHHVGGRGLLTENQRSLCLAALVVITTGGALGYAMLRGGPRPLELRVGPLREVPAPAWEGRGAPPPGSGAVAAHAPRVTGIRSTGDRTQLAATWEGKWRARGRPLTVKVSGEGERVFSLRWPAGQADKEHMAELQRAKIFQRELRAHGFRTLEMRVGERVVWRHDL